MASKQNKERLMRMALVNKKKNNSFQKKAEESEAEQLNEMLNAQNTSYVEEDEAEESDVDLYNEMLNAQNTSYVEEDEAEESDVDLYNEMLNAQNTPYVEEDEAEESDVDLYNEMLNAQNTPYVKEVTEKIPTEAVKCKSTDFLRTSKASTGKETDVFFDIAINVIERFKLCRLLDDDTDTIWRYNGRCYEPISEKRVKDLIYKNFTKQFKRDNNNIKVVVNSVLEFVKHEIRVNPNYNKNFSEEDFEKTKNYIVFLNCIYDLLTDSVLDFSEDLACWLSVNANYLFPLDGEEFPESYQLLKSRAMNEDSESMKMLDYTTALLFMNRSVKHFFVAGNASNSGKSVYFSFVDRLMPSGRVMHFEPEDLGGNFGLDGIGTAALVSCADVQTKEFDEKRVSVIKRLTGDSYVRANRKHRGAVEERVFTKILFGTNGGFKLSNYDEGIKNRLIVLPFVNSVSEQDRDEMLLTKLLQDKDLIMSICAKKLGDILYRDGSLLFPESELSKEMKKSWLMKEDFVEDFFSSCIYITGNKKDCISKKTLHQAYVDFFNTKAELSNVKNLHMINEEKLEKMIIALSKGKAFHGRDRMDEDGIKRQNLVFRLRGCKLINVER